MKERLDVLLVNFNFFSEIEKARRAIMAGIVIVNEKKVDKCGTIIKFEDEPNIRIKGDTLKYVSRGGKKLEKAMEVFSLDFSEKIVLDVGASTGGFTDCVLQNGAKFVYAVDVGTNQLDWKLRNDTRVKSIENKHINDLKIEDIENQKIDYIVMDISFISIKKVLDCLKKFFNENTKLMALIKPQFEVDKYEIEKGGIVKNKEIHIKIIDEIVEFAERLGFFLEGLDVSPITGTKGNIEYISLFGLNKSKKIEIDVESVVYNNQKVGGKNEE